MAAANADPPEDLDRIRNQKLYPLPLSTMGIACVPSPPGTARAGWNNKRFYNTTTRGRFFARCFKRNTVFLFVKINKRLLSAKANAQSCRETNLCTPLLNMRNAKIKRT